MTATVNRFRADVDPLRWPDVASVRPAPIRAALAQALLNRVVGRLPIRVRFPSGVLVGAEGPVLRLRRPRDFFARLGADGLIGFGESYQAGDWDSEDLVALLTVLARDLTTLVPPKLQWLRHLHGSRFPRGEANTVDGAKANIHRHYDLSNELFALFLDETMSYSSGLFDTSGDMVAAQHRKIDRLLDLTRVHAGSRVLEIGTGWGELAIRAARRGATVDTVTLSTEQRDLAVARVARAGVAERVDVRLCDYREIPFVARGYDAILSVEMIEAVGAAYWPTYLRALEAHLAPGGHVGLQMITMDDARMRATRSTYTWIHKYVFPGGLIPSVPAIRAVLAAETSLRVVDQLDFGQDYATTLRLWRDRFNARTADLPALGFDDTFARTWNFYLAYCEAGFATGYIDVCQLVLGRS